MYNGDYGVYSVAPQFNKVQCLCVSEKVQLDAMCLRCLKTGVYPNSNRTSVQLGVVPQYN